MRREVKSTQREMRVLELIVTGTGTAALTGPASNQATLTDNGAGDYTITFDEPFGNDPIVEVTAETTSIIPRIISKSNTAVRISTLLPTLSAGAAAVVTISEQTAGLVSEGLTLYSKLPGAAGNTVQFEKTAGATAGNEVVTVTGKVVSVQVEAGVSTATQVLAKLIASPGAMNLISAFDTTGATAQTAAVAANLTGGVDAVAGTVNTLQALTFPLTDAVFHAVIIGSEVAEKY